MGLRVRLQVGSGVSIDVSAFGGWPVTLGGGLGGGFGGGSRYTNKNGPPAGSW